VLVYLGGLGTGSRKLLFNAYVEVKNKGIKPGYITRTELKASSLRCQPEVQVISHAPRQVGALSTREIDFLIVVDHPAAHLGSTAEFGLDLFDEEDRCIGSITWEGGVGRGPKDGE
jgi:hypothetical protein